MLDPETKVCTRVYCPSTQVCFLPKVGRLSAPQREAGSPQKRLSEQLFFRKVHYVCGWFGFAVSWTRSFEQREQSPVNTAAQSDPCVESPFPFFFFLNALNSPGSGELSLGSL